MAKTESAELAVSEEKVALFLLQGWRPCRCQICRVSWTQENHPDRLWFLGRQAKTIGELAKDGSGVDEKTEIDVQTTV